MVAAESGLPGYRARSPSRVNMAAVSEAVVGVVKMVLLALGALRRPASPLDRAGSTRASVRSPARFSRARIDPP
jgi:hypothetical protein